MITIGIPKYLALRVTKGRLDKHGTFHDWQPCVFFIVGNKRRP